MLKDCPVCKTNKYVRVDSEYVGFGVCCGGCYDADCVGDPLEYVSTSLTARGRTQEEAIQSWNDLIADYYDTDVMDEN